MVWFKDRFSCLIQGPFVLFSVQLLGVVFILSALLKSLDITAFAVQVSYFGLVRTPWLVKTLAVFIVGMEAALGGMLLLKVNLKRVTLPVTFGVLVIFSGLLVWAWLFTGIKDCGCFGKFLKMTPGASLLKNCFLVGLCVIGWQKAATVSELPDTGRSPLLDRSSFLPFTSSALAPLGMAFAIMALALISAKSGPTSTGGGVAPGTNSAGSGEAASNTSDRKLAKYSMQWDGKRIELGRGVHLVALLSDSCEHCSELVEGLNRYGQDPRLPMVAGLILGEEDTYKQFKASFHPQFATMRIPVLEFFDLLGNAPPRFYLTAEGKPIKFWDDQLPSAEDILREAAKAGIKFK